eukprot:gene4729-9393_t
MHLSALSLILLGTTNAFVPFFSRIAIRNGNSIISAGKPDLFSDDLFEDDDSKNKAKDLGKSPEAPAQRKYLEEKWQLNKEDAKDFKGFMTPTKTKAGKPMSEVPPGNAPKVPAFALLYKFRKEYLDASVDAFMADHKGYASKFKRIMSSELINLGKSRGVVLIFAGFNENDKVETKAEITTFLEEDPLLVQDAIETWDLIDLTKSGSSVELAPSEPVSP